MLIFYNFTAQKSLLIIKNDTSSYTGTWVNPNGVVRGTVS